MDYILPGKTINIINLKIIMYYRRWFFFHGKDPQKLIRIYGARSNGRSSL